ncbi:uncharacterized protein FFE2_08577 [Fusarium fujikuroi]|uniref:Uncharacterized protein n=1 Tax=Fusarium fujikuroi TaxID=5127 RepID=A0A9Q9RQ12_FUSFU|nr:uncharacterized protein FFE2_08577 [Fusarium fujikuroi]VTT74587.1 unnamed protein product [Fusarium fujikuroi]
MFNGADTGPVGMAEMLNAVHNAQAEDDRSTFLRFLYFRDQRRHSSKLHYPETVSEAEARRRRTGVAHEKYEAQMRRIQTVALDATDEAQELSPAIPLGQPLVLVPSFRATTVMPWMKPFPSMDTRKAIWEDVGDGKLTRAVHGPFEVAIPP